MATYSNIYTRNCSSYCSLSNSKVSRPLFSSKSRSNFLVLMKYSTMKKIYCCFFNRWHFFYFHFPFQCIHQVLSKYMRNPVVSVKVPHTLPFKSISEHTPADDVTQHIFPFRIFKKMKRNGSLGWVEVYTHDFHPEVNLTSLLCAWTVPEHNQMNVDLLRQKTMCRVSACRHWFKMLDVHLCQMLPSMSEYDRCTTKISVFNERVREKHCLNCI